MPADLNKAHQTLDKAVDVAYGYKSVQSKAEGAGKDDATRVACLFALYQDLLAKTLGVVNRTQAVTEAIRRVLMCFGRQRRMWNPTKPGLDTAFYANYDTPDGKSFAAQIRLVSNGK